MTRERIRQKQRKLLREISKGLLDEHYETFEFRFRPEYSALWQKAEDAFEGQEEPNAKEFLSTLSAAWEVSITDLLEHIPFIFAVLTKSGKVPRSFKVYAQFPTVFGTKLPDLIKEKPLHSHPTG